MTFLICQSRFLIFDAGCVPFRSSPKYGRHIFSFQVLPRLPAFRAYFVNDYGLIIALFGNFTKPIIRPRSKLWRIISHINSQRLLCKIVGRCCFDIFPTRQGHTLSYPRNNTARTPNHIFIYLGGVCFHIIIPITLCQHPFCQFRLRFPQFRCQYTYFPCVNYTICGRVGNFRILSHRPLLVV